ncbi:conserved unknown protein [Ectocarpus siliculosus]|uniref:Selenoprotein O n=1 Tax=Ectocarpus siliculosus TaxID=2880 RepID=D7G7V9_ECTSI|nr:conserved unknown protein [Ectocarpus siliculosus]|eukprot:CBJ27840.1 conserved unknown protein [Ectocarpus siliculosus]
MEKIGLARCGLYRRTPSGRRFRFGRSLVWVAFAGLTRAFVHTSVPLLLRPRSDPGCFARVSSHSGDENFASLEGRWPWVCERPGRCADLPAEEVFTGFDGLFDDDTDQDASGTSESYSKVSREVRNACYAFVSLDSAPDPKVVILSKTAAALTGIPLEFVGATRRENQGAEGAFPPCQLKQVALALTGTVGLEGAQPFSSSYGGHQFGNWAGQLGDGRVATLGEILSDGQSEIGRVAGKEHVAGKNLGGLVEIQLKGIGQTPFSRGGDGKAVLGACLREFLFSEAFLGLGLPAAVAVSVCSSGESATIRDSDPKNGGTFKRARGAVLCRTAPSFLRFGSFELPARRGDVTLVRKLADYCLRHLSPHFESSLLAHATGSGDERTREFLTSGKDLGIGRNEEDGQAQGNGKESNQEMGARNDYVELLVAIVQATARMVAGWQAMGFCHGVLNTDNFTLLGLGLDFGPCSFMEAYDPTWSPNEGDSALRYAFRNQPDVSAWNCERLAEAFSPIVGVSGVAEANAAFSPAFDAAYTVHLQKKLGLSGMDLGSGWIHPRRSGDAPAGEMQEKLPPDAQFVLSFFDLMAACRTDFTETWRALLDVPALSVARKARRNLTTEHLEATGVEDDICNDDEETLRPLSSVLNAAGASSTARKQWATWIRDYSSRIDSQGIGNGHPEGGEEGRKERLAIMRSSNPVFVLRKKSLEQALKAAETGDLTLVHQLEERLSRTYTGDRNEEGVTRQPPEAARVSA